MGLLNTALFTAHSDIKLVAYTTLGTSNWGEQLQQGFNNEWCSSIKLKILYTGLSELNWAYRTGHSLDQLRMEQDLLLFFSNSGQTFTALTIPHLKNYIHCISTLNLFWCCSRNFNLVCICFCYSERMLLHYYNFYYYFLIIETSMSRSHSKQPLGLSCGRKQKIDISIWYMTARNELWC